ncbi:MAG TPA: hypothetical protein VMF60_07035 [Acidimicrobiales bacterium]|nr:hypothetical protein [Acidimicrobiales bacterium]
MLVALGKTEGTVLGVSGVVLGFRLVSGRGDRAAADEAAGPDTPPS